MRKLLKPIVAIVVFAAIAGAAGTAFAYWRSTGTGSGVASTGSMQTVTITSSTVSNLNGSLLYPGHSADVVLKVNNPNAFAVHVVSINQIVGQQITASGASGTCSTTGVTYTPPLSFADIPAGASTIRLTNAAAMSTSSESGCQGATFNVPVTLSVKA